jgi:hypothetical protein
MGDVRRGQNSENEDTKRGLRGCSKNWRGENDYVIFYKKV